MNIEIPGFVNENIFNDLLILEDHDKGFIENIIEIYLEQCSDIINDLYNIVLSKDFDKCSKLAHTLKGSSSNFGLNNMILSCEKIMYLCRNIDLSQEDLLEKIIIEIKLLEDNFKISSVFLLKFRRKK